MLLREGDGVVCLRKLCLSQNFSAQLILMNDQIVSSDHPWLLPWRRNHPSRPVPRSMMLVPSSLKWSRVDLRRCTLRNSLLYGGLSWCCGSRGSLLACSSIRLLLSLNLLCGQTLMRQRPLPVGCCLPRWCEAIDNLCGWQIGDWRVLS